MGKTSQKEKRLAGRVSLVLAAGMFSVAPVVHGMPKLDNVDARSDATVTNTSAIRQDISATKKNNIINWKDFSIANGETVAFDDKNYMNIVTGKATSAIYGEMTANGGDIYLINPNGVIFGSTARVDVGNLYVSTREATDAIKNAFAGTAENPTTTTQNVSAVLPALSSSASLTADVVNLIDTNGYVKANQVVMEGRNIRFLNSSSVVTSVTKEPMSGVITSTSPNTNADSLILRSNTDGYVHVGDEKSNYKYVAQLVTDAIATTVGNVTTITNNGNGVDYALVHNGKELAAMTTNDSNANFMLAGNITINNEDENNTMTAAVGTSTSPFKGKFDGNFYTVSNLTLTGVSNSYNGLFGYTEGARIENVGVQNVTLEGQYAGGIIGHASNTSALNVWNESGSIGSSLDEPSGGIIGFSSYSTLKNAYNASSVKGAGLVGKLDHGSISDSYNIGSLMPQSKKIYGIVYNNLNHNGAINNVYTASKVYHTYDSNVTEHIASNIQQPSTESKQYVIGTTNVSSLTASSFDSASTEGGSGATWRLYQGTDQLPLLTAFFKGTVSTDYNYQTYKTDGSANGDPLNSLQQYAGADGIVGTADDGIAGKTYDAHAISPFTSPVPHYEISSTGNFVYKNGDYVEATDADAALIHYARVDNVDYLGANADSAKIIANTNRFNQQDVELSGNNATSFALFASGQQGYDLYGNNFIIKKRSVAFDPNNPPDFVKTYDGDADAAPLLKNMLSGATPIAGDTDTGFIGTDSTYVNFWIDPTKVTAKFGTGTTKEAFVENGNTTWANDVNTKRNILVDGVVGGSGDNATVKLQAKTVDGDGITPEQAAKAQIVVRNYELSTESAAALNGVYTNKGTINQRKVKVELKNNTGIDKTYDGTTAVLDAYNGVSNITATSLADDDLTKDIKDSSVISALFGNEKEAGKVAFGTITASYNNQNVNLIQDPNYPNDTAKKTEGTRTVTYSGIVLTGNTSNNYLLVDAQDNPLTSGTLTGSGTIKRRKINASDFEIANSGNTPPPHVYDGNDHVNLDIPLAITIADEKQKTAGNQTIDPGETAPTGIISDDYNASLFQTSKITFRDGSGNPTADASDSSLDTKAVKATYDVEATNATLGNNYIWSNEAGYTGNVITRRELRVELRTNANIDKTYDGTATVKGKDANNKSYTDFGGPYMQYAEGATYHLIKTDGVKDADDSTKALDDKVHIEVSAVYKKQPGAPDSERDQDVARNADGTANLDANKKDVQYSIAVVNDTGSTKNNAANYLIVAKSDNEWTAVTANDARLRATGKIDQMDLTGKITLDGAKKLYDGTKAAYVTEVDTHVKTLPTINLKQGASLGDGDSIENVFGNQTGNDGYLSKLSNGTYADANAAGTAEIEVQYADVGNALQGTLRGSNYKITGTVYGKGYIEKNHISATDWQAWVNPVSNAANLFKKTYNGDNGYTGTAPNVADLLPTTGHVLGISDAEWNAGSLSIAYSIATYSQKDAGEYTKNDANNYVSVAFTVSGELANYTYDNSFTGKYNGTIEKAPITVSVIHGAPSKTYDGTTAVVTNDDTLTVGDALSTVKDNNWNHWLQLSGAINETEGNNLKLQNGVTAKYANKNATDNATVIYENIQLLNDEVGKNYQISNLSSDTTINKGITGTGTINKRTIQLNYGVTTKTYDGNADVTNKTFKAVSYNSDGKDWTTLKKDNIITDVTGDNAGIITHADLSGFYLQTGSSASDPYGWDNNKAENVRRKGEERTVANKDVQYIGLTSVFNSDNYVVIDADANKVIDKDNSIAKNFVTVTNGGVINPVKFHMNDGDVFLKNTTVSRAYSGTTTIDDAKSDLNYTATTINPIASNVASGVLLVTGNFESADANTGDAKQKVTYTVKLNPEKDIINFDLDGTHRKENSNAEAEYVFNNTGKITPKVIYAHLDNDKIKESVGSNASADKIKEYLTKTYDGDADVEKNISSWVQLDTASTTAIAAIVAAGGKGVVLADGITTEYVTDAYVQDKNAADVKKIAFRNIALQAAADTAADAINNYKLVLKDGDTELVEDTPLTTTGAILKRGIKLTFTDPANLDKDYDGKVNIKSDAIDAMKASFAIEATPVDGNTGLVGTDTLALNTSGLTGVYGSWDPNGEVFQENSHVKYKNEAGQDVPDVQAIIYYGITLTGDESVLQNYKLDDSDLKTVKSESGAEFTKTVYFKEATSKGIIKPLALTGTAIYETWSNPVEKVYDGDKSILGVDANGGVIAKSKLKDYFKVYCDPSLENITGIAPFEIEYDIANATAEYNDKNAGSNKAFTYKGFTFSNQTLGDIAIDMNARYTPEGATTTVANSPSGQDAVVGSIARRVISISAEDVKHTKVYDGTPDYSGTYDLAKLAARNQNDAKTQELIGKDNVSVTYVANWGQSNASIDPTVDRTNPDNWNISNVTYTFNLADANYELEDPKANTDKRVKEITDQKGAIVKRTIKVAWKDEEGQNLDKTYDGSPSLVDADGNLYKDGNTKLTDILKFTDSAGTGQGILDGDVSKVGLIIGKAVYLDGNGNESADANARIDKALDTREVLLQNMSIEGDASGNYYLETTERKGKGDIYQKSAGTIMVDAEKNTREYNGKSAASTKKADGTASYVTLNPSGVLVADQADFKFEVESAIYYDKSQGETPANPTGYVNAKDGLGVLYRLKWNNQNYTLERVAYGEGDIKPRTLKYKNVGEISIDKTYDGTTDIEDVTAVADGLFSNVVSGEDVKLVKMDDVSHYAHANTGAAANSKSGEAQAVSLGFTIGNRNYRLSAENDLPGAIVATDAVLDAEDGKSYSRTGMYTGTGRINRAEVTMTPTEVSYYPSQLATAKYKGQASGFVNGDARPTMTYGRDGNTSAAVGSYTLLGYVNSKQVPVNGATFVDGFENYYFTTTPNKYLNILAEPVNPDNPVTPDIPDFDNKTVTRAVTESVISDTKFTPDEYSYNRMSKDPDTTHVNRVSSATLQYSEKGVNIEGEDTKSGLASLADIQGRGSVVNLNGALIQTSAPAEQPEKVAETAALPISETDTTEDATLLPLPENEENDVSSIGLEYADNTGGSQSVLEILTNASSKAENKGTSIVIDTQDEDEEDAEIEKTRRAIFADRSNIGIETLGNAVNLNQMIG